MRAAAGHYYEQRARQLNLGEVPVILDKDIVELLPRDRDRSAVADALGLAVRTLQSIEPFVVAGVQGVYDASGYLMMTPGWQHVQKTGRRHGFTDAEKYAGRQMRPLLAGAIACGAQSVSMQAITRGQVPARAWLRALGNSGRYDYAQPHYEAAQTYIITQEYDLNGAPAFGHLTIAQGVHDWPGYNRSESHFLSPRYFGAPLHADEVAELKPVLLDSDGTSS